MAHRRVLAFHAELAAFSPCRKSRFLLENSPRVVRFKPFLLTGIYLGLIRMGPFPEIVRLRAFFAPVSAVQPVPV